LSFPSAQGGGIYHEEGTTTLTNTTVTNNKAQEGGGVFSSGGLLILRSGTHIVLNHAQKGTQLSNPAATVLYELPTSSGTYLPNDYICQKNKCNTPPCGQICDYTRFPHQRLANLSLVVNDAIPYPCLLGHWCDGNQTGACPAGQLGNTTNFSSLDCGGLCPRRYYCQEGSAAPIPCAGGTYGNATGLSNQDECHDCPAGSWCEGGRAFACEVGTFNPNPRQQSLDVCRPCPVGTRTTTLLPGRTSQVACVCDAGAMRELGTFACTDPPLGFATSEQPGTDTLIANVTHGHWRPFHNATQAKACPVTKTCVGEALAGDELCAPGFGGPYCTSCSSPHHYIDTLQGSCRSCDSAAQFVGIILLAILGTLVTTTFVAGCVASKTCCVRPTRWSQLLRHSTLVPAAAGFQLLKGLPARMCQTHVATRLKTAAEAVGIRAKLKIVLGMYLVIAQVSQPPARSFHCRLSPPVLCAS
jgi:hypothetical protein